MEKYLHVFLCLSGCFIAGIADAGTITYRIEAFIDGKDFLYIQGNSLQWKHQEFAAVGRMSGHNYPTIINSKKDGIDYLSNYEWVPEWPDMPPEEIRYQAVSSIFNSLLPGLPTFSDIISISLNPIISRSITTISQYPTFGNQGIMVIEFNDNVPWGAEWYTAEITVEYVPEPASLLLLGLGGLLVRKRKLNWRTER